MAFRGDPSMSQLTKVKLILKVQKHLLETVFLLLSVGHKVRVFLIGASGRVVLPTCNRGTLKSNIESTHLSFYKYY
jgi:hypothetical protein